MPNQRRKTKMRVDFWLDPEERRVLKELSELTDAKSMTDVCRYMIEQAALANGIVPPRKVADSKPFQKATAQMIPVKKTKNQRKK